MKEKLLINNVTLGTDPEFFLFSEETGSYVPVCGLIGGSKDEPLPVTDTGFALQEDGATLEVCVPPSKTPDEFVENITFIKNYVNDTVLKPLNLVLKCVPFVKFSLAELPDGKPLPLGCSPDYNAWTNEENVIDRLDEESCCAGGHIHIGYDNPGCDINIKIVQAMDLFLGLKSILLDTDTNRRKLYGKAGSHRHQGHGVEYRTLSNFWLETPELVKWAAEQSLLAVEFVNVGGIITNPEDIQYAINNNDKEVALSILEEYNISLTELIN